MLTDDFVKFINDLQGLYAEETLSSTGLEQIEIIEPSILKGRNVVICIPKDKLERFLHKISRA